MTRLLTAALLLGLLPLSAAQAQLFPRGPDALKYGAYTGGHSYSYNTAYSYGLSFSAADSWWRDPFAYPAGVLPYRPYGRPIIYRVFPNPPTPYYSVPAPNGLKALIRPDAVPPEFIDPRGPGYAPAPVLPAPTVVPMAATLGLRPVPAGTEARVAQIHIAAPAGAEVWIDKEKLPVGNPAVFRSPPLAPGASEVYSVRAKWTQGGREFEQFRAVAVGAGETATLSFPVR